MSPAEELERTLHRDIPLSQAMGIRVVGYDGACLQLAAPLEPNTNHKSTAFGGSLYSLAVLCGWGLLHLKLQEAGLHKHIVIQESSIRHLLPVSGELRAGSHIEADALQRFMHMLEKRGRARIALETEIFQEDKVAVAFSGRYVVHG